MDSRGAMAIRDVLLDAAKKNGHSYLPWKQLKAAAFQYLNASGMRLASRTTDQSFHACLLLICAQNTIMQ